MKRYHVKFREPRYLDMNDHSRLLDHLLFLIVIRRIKKRIINWIFGRSKS